MQYIYQIDLQLKVDDGVKESLVSHTWTSFEGVVHVHTTDEKWAKLDVKREKLIFVGYDQSSNDYKLYNPNNNKIVINRDRIFDEEGECTLSPEKGI